MAKFEGKGSMTQRNLVAMWRDENLTRNDDGKVTGAWIDVQLAQPDKCPDYYGGDYNQAVDAIVRDDAQKDPSINVRSKKDGGTYVKPVWYSRSQIRQMAAANGGKLFEQADDKGTVYAASFKGNVAPLKDMRTGKTNMVVLMAKDPSRAKDDTEREKIEKYNVHNKLGPSDFGKADEVFLKRQSMASDLIFDYEHMVMADAMDPALTGLTEADLMLDDEDMGVSMEAEANGDRYNGNVGVASDRADGRSGDHIEAAFDAGVYDGQEPFDAEPVARNASAVPEHGAKSAGGKSGPDKLQARKATHHNYKNQALIGVWTDKDIRYDKNGDIKVINIDMQVDQSSLSKQDIAAGKGYSSPSIQYAFSRTPALVPNKEFYTKKQLDYMLDAGSVADYGSLHGCSFTANVYVKHNDATGKAKSIVCFPRDEANARSFEELDTIRWYNDVNKLSGSCHENFGPDDLRNQIEVTKSVRAMTESKAKQQGKSSFVAAVENGGSHLDRQGDEGQYDGYGND